MICIIIPNFNGLQHLDVCLNSLRYQTYNNYKVFFVDNGSSDNSIEYVKENFPEVVIIPLDKNYGFAYATNAGIKKALELNMFQYILFLNNDMECDSHFLENLVLGFTNNDVGCVSPKILNYYNRDVIDTTGDYLDLYSYPYKRGFGDKDTGQYDKKGFIFGACGGSALYKTDVFNKIGLLDNTFFAYYEDIDLNYRMQLAGFKCYYEPDSFCYHKCGATIKNTHSKKFFLMERNLTILQVKNYHMKLLFKYVIISILKRLWNFLRFIKKRQFSFFFSSVKGFLAGFLLSFKYLGARRDIKMMTVSSPEYMENISMDYKRGYKEFLK
jgi:GT2 family glycosyltransferase